MADDAKLTGTVAPELIRIMEIPRLDKDIIAGYAELSDLTGTVSDAMDTLGLNGAIPATVLIPTLQGKRMVGQAITMRNTERKESIYRSAREGIKQMGGTQAFNLAKAGDVMVIEGLPGMSNMGGQSAVLAQRQGLFGAVIDGSYRDPDASREVGFPIWARGVTPITGKWRLETVEINGRVRIAGVAVDAGDLVVADDAGIVFVPLEHASQVLAESRKIDGGDKKRKEDIAAGVDLKTLESRQYRDDYKPHR